MSTPINSASTVARLGKRNWSTGRNEECTSPHQAVLFTRQHAPTSRSNPPRAKAAVAAKGVADASRHTTGKGRLFLSSEQNAQAAIHFSKLTLFVVRTTIVWSVQRRDDSYLVDPASSHMLVSKIKPCMSKYKRLYTVKLRMAH